MTVRRKTNKHLKRRCALGFGIAVLAGGAAIVAGTDEPNPSLRIIGLQVFSDSEIVVRAEINDSNAGLEWRSSFTNTSIPKPGLTVVGASDHEVVLFTERPLEEFRGDCRVGYVHFPDSGKICFEERIRFPIRPNGEFVFAARYRSLAEQGSKDSVWHKVPVIRSLLRSSLVRRVENRQHFGSMIFSQPVSWPVKEEGQK